MHNDEVNCIANDSSDLVQIVVAGLLAHLEQSGKDTLSPTRISALHSLLQLPPVSPSTGPLRVDFCVLLAAAPTAESCLIPSKQNGPRHPVDGRCDARYSYTKLYE